MTRDVCVCVWQLRVSPDNNYTWVPNAQYGTYCKDQTSVQTVNGSVVQCNEGLASYGGLDSCAGGQYAVHRLIVVAQCFDTHLDINGKLVSKQSLVGACLQAPGCGAWL